MAQFRATIQGQRGSASRLGSKSSGLHVTANGWNGGIEIHIRHEDGKDHFYAVRTGGSGGQGNRTVLAEFSTEG